MSAVPAAIVSRHGNASYIPVLDINKHRHILRAFIKPIYIQRTNHLCWLPREIGRVYKNQRALVIRTVGVPSMIRTVRNDYKYVQSTVGSIAAKDTRVEPAGIWKM